jgi:hypothetical protein
MLHTPFISVLRDTDQVAHESVEGVLLRVGALLFVAWRSRGRLVKHVRLLARAAEKIPTVRGSFATAGSNPTTATFTTT